MDAIYISGNSFKVLEDRTGEFNASRRVKMDCGLDGVKYASVVSSSYSLPYTTVVIDESDLTAALVSAWYGVTQTGEIGSFPDHTHEGDIEGQGGQLDSEDLGITFLSLLDTPATYSGTDGQYLMSTGSGTEWATVDGGASTLIDLTDTPAAYDDGKYLISTVTGTEWATVDGGASTLIDLTDTPAGYDYGKFLKSIGDSTRWADVLAGTGWESGVGVPSGALGNTYNYYLNTATGQIYTKTDLIYGSDQCSGGTATADSIFSGTYSADKAFDNNHGTYWIRNQLNDFPAWLQYQFTTQKQIQKIRIRIRPSYAITRGPSDFIVKASNTGSFSGEEVDLYSTTGATYSEGVYSEFFFANEDIYLYYRIHITDNNGDGNYIDIAEVEMIEIDSSDWELIYTPTLSGLADTPAAYDDGKFLMSTAVGTEWTTVTGSTTFLDLTDTPSTYDDGYYLRVTTSGITTVSGIILEAPSGSEWLIQVTNSGILYTTEVV